MPRKPQSRRPDVRTADAPTPEREQHDRVERLEGPIADVEGNYAQPFRAEGMLERLVRQGDAGERELLAGMEFRRLVSIGWTESLRAASLDERIISGITRLPHGNDAARKRVNAILDTLGAKGDSLAASCAWHVVGHDMTLQDWVLRLRWSSGDRRILNVTAAKGVLLTTLDQIALALGSGPKKSA